MSHIQSNTFFHQLLEFTTLAAGWQRVRDNHGCAGADGICVKKFEKDLFANLTQLQQEIRRGTYAPYPLLQIQVKKPKGGIRTLSLTPERLKKLREAVNHA